MSTLKMVLKDGTEIVLSEFTLPMHIVMVRDTREEVQALWDDFTEQALAEVQIQEDGETIFTFTDCSVAGEQIMVDNANGTVTGHYYLEGQRQTTTGSSEYETAAKILLGEES